MGGACNTMGESIVVYRIWVRKPEEKNHFEDPGIDWSIILK
jgi:hypothetical protein